ncbi:MAG: thioredoxin domain-containing protein, partial [Candidatus Nanohaloarchaea archaeon]|nr:thioredoxin domain-containing protein [Candidatus Nanohaloarchaea archaeon]
MRRILALLIGAVVLAGCTGGPQGRAQTFDKGTVLHYDQVTVYFSAADPWRGVINWSTQDGVKRFTVLANMTVRESDVVPASQAGTAPLHPQHENVVFLLNDVLNWSRIEELGNGTVTVQGGRLHLSPPTTYHGLRAYNMTTGQNTIVVAAAPPHPVLFYSNGPRTYLELRSIGTGTFGSGTPGTSEPAAGRGTVIEQGARARLDVAGPVNGSVLGGIRQAIGSQLDATFAVARGTDADVVVKAATTRETLRDAVQRISAAGEFGAWLPLPRDGTFTLAGTTHTVAVQDGAVTIDGTTYTSRRFIHDGMQYAVENRGGSTYYPFIQVFDADDIVSVRSSQRMVTSTGSGYQWQLPIRVTAAAARRMKDVAGTYQAGRQFLLLDGSPVELRFVMDATPVSTVQVSTAFQRVAVRSPTIAGGASSLTRARQEMDRIERAVTTGALDVELSLLGVAAFGSGSPDTGETRNTTSPGQEQDAQRDTAAPDQDAPSDSDTSRYNGTVPDITGVAPVQSAADDPTIGQQDAPVTIEYFSGLSSRCSFCQRFARRTFGRIAETYVANGTVKLVFRDFPWMHRMADQELVYAEASQCVWRASPSAYWTWHASMLNHVNNWTRREVVEMTRSVPGVDGDAVQSCLAEDRAADEVSSDIQAATDAGLRGSPSFVVSGPAGSTTVVGAREFSAFADAIAAV